MPNEYPVTEDFGMNSPAIMVQPPPEIEREFSPEFKKVRKKFGKLAEKKIQAALEASTHGMGGDKQMMEATSLVNQMKHLEQMS
jgi:hypothetical protein